VQSSNDKEVGNAIQTLKEDHVHVPSSRLGRFYKSIRMMFTFASQRRIIEPYVSWWYTSDEYKIATLVSCARLGYFRNRALASVEAEIFSHGPAQEILKVQSQIFLSTATDCQMSLDNSKLSI